jgi:hypothetical protein
LNILNKKDLNIASFLFNHEKEACVNLLMFTLPAVAIDFCSTANLPTDRNRARRVVSK